MLDGIKILILITEVVFALGENFFRKPKRYYWEIHKFVGLTIHQVDIWNAR